MKEDWTKECEKSLDKIKRVILNVLIFYHLDWSKEFVVATDASQYRVGAVLLQEVENEKRYIEFAAKSLIRSQKNYFTVKKKLLAIIFTLKRWHYILYERRFQVETNHKALVYLNQSKKYMILDWLDFILEFDFYVVHRKEITNLFLNALFKIYGIKSETERIQKIFDVQDLKVESTLKKEIEREMRKIIEEVANFRLSKII
jgi:hypothetical protein